MAIHRPHSHQCFSRENRWSSSLGYLKRTGAAFRVRTHALASEWNTAYFKWRVFDALNHRPSSSCRKLKPHCMTTEAGPLCCLLPANESPLMRGWRGSQMVMMKRCRESTQVLVHGSVPFIRADLCPMCGWCFIVPSSYLPSPWGGGWCDKPHLFRRSLREGGWQGHGHNPRSERQAQCSFLDTTASTVGDKWRSKETQPPNKINDF